jgi:hypothetical protein
MNLRSAALFAALSACGGSVAAESPANLKWWSDDNSAIAGQQASPAPAMVRVAQPATGERKAVQADTAGLNWWEARQATDDLNWWKAQRDGKSLAWWSRDAGVGQVAAQQNAFERQPNPMSSDENPMPPAATGGDSSVPAMPDVDPFTVVPRLKPLSDIQVTLSPAPPTDVTASSQEPVFRGTAEQYFATKGSVFLAPRSWPQRTPEAAAYQFYSRPLWFEDANVERCGQTVGCLQPVCSGTYFFANTLLMPYRFAAEPQCATVPQKQFCPPGCRYTHAQNYLPPWSPAGALAEGAAATGLIFLIP